MSDAGSAGGRGPEDLEHLEDLEQVEQRLAEIRNRKRGRIRWAIGRHTAEVAIGALAADHKTASRKNGKSRRRKRNKRLL
jgi:hypothetical protein